MLVPLQVPRALPAPAAPEEEQPVAWLNAMLGRLLWDFLGEAHWAEMVSKKIQMKLSKIRVSEPRLVDLYPRRLSEAPCSICGPRVGSATSQSSAAWFNEAHRAGGTNTSQTT